VLFDEPETHLHPNAVASLFNVLTAILQEYEKVTALVSIHTGRMGSGCRCTRLGVRRCER
jgi:predicted ATP-dependent endonuclease of OLD family